MVVTEEYLGLDEDVRNCQMKEDFENCTTRQYLSAVQKLCNCVPYPLRHLISTNMIQVMIIHRIRIGTFKKACICNLQTTCNSKGAACAQNIKVDTSACMAPCEGIFADVKKLPPADIKKENTDMFIERYKNYKKFFEPSEGTTPLQILHL